MNAVKGYKTLVFAALVALSGFLASPEVTAWAASNAQYVGLALGVAIAALRVVTSSPILKSDE